MTESDAPDVVEVTALVTPPGWGRAEQRASAERFVGELGPVTRICRHCGSRAHGQPMLKGGRRISLSYTDRLMLVAVADRPVGVDVEHDGPAPPGYADRRAWTLAEAVLKASGEGLRGASESVAAWTAGLDLPQPYVGTVALLGNDPAEISLQWAGAGAPCGRSTE
ncbi:MAG: hypothetical protein WBP61_13695 [Nocardioides sp.]